MNLSLKEIILNLVGNFVIRNFVPVQFTRGRAMESQFFKGGTLEPSPQEGSRCLSSQEASQHLSLQEGRKVESYLKKGRWNLSSKQEGRAIESLFEGEKLEPQIRTKERWNLSFGGVKLEPQLTEGRAMESQFEGGKLEPQLTGWKSDGILV